MKQSYLQNHDQSCHPFLIALIVVIGMAAIPAASVEGRNEIIFSENFESGALDQWDADSVLDDPTRLRLTNAPEYVFRGNYAVEITAQIGKEKGAKLNKWFLPGYDRVYARWYCKFAEDFDQGNHMHFVHLLANRQDNRWSAFGKAGKKPNGDDFYTIGLEPWRDWGRNAPPGEWMFYSYHMDMPLDPKMNAYYGEMYRPDEKHIPQRGRWYCMEMMVKANTPGEADGEQAFWIDGELIGRFTGIRWRTDAALKINDFWLLLYVHDSPKINRVWFDEIVISQNYIGPLENESGTNLPAIEK
ncbi:MAG: hypothetical protein C4527_26005 [Candidatus Omnitrophota bacterium]|nr:MAG: hypothetical protein C4527_26005 [Candidatus Omnitrophota bacterium]